MSYMIRAHVGLGDSRYGEYCDRKSLTFTSYVMTIPFHVSYNISSDVVTGEELNKKFPHK